MNDRQPFFVVWLGLFLLTVDLASLADQRRCVAAEEVDAVVLWDWHFRESLGAIRDWEAILAGDRATPDAESPLVPVPENGEPVLWLNPIPPALIPPEHRNRAVQLRWVDGQIEVRRTGMEEGESLERGDPGSTVLGYQHPGGGGKSRWGNYHVYQRRFDRLTRFRTGPAPFVLSLPTPVDLQPGRNTLTVAVRNVSAQPLTLAFEWKATVARAQEDTQRREIHLEVGAEQAVDWTVELGSEGGGLVVLSITCRDQSYWTAWLTHVEDVSAVLESVDQVLEDTPDEQAAERLTMLRQTAEEARRDGFPESTDWRSIFQQASRLRDELLWERIDFGSLLFVRRKPFTSEQPFMDAHHQYNRPGGGIYRLEPVRPTGRVTPVVDRLGEGIYRDLCLHWDAQRLLFAFGNGGDFAPATWTGDRTFRLYEVQVDGGGLRRLASGPKSDIEPFYLPSGEIGFTSDRGEYYIMCGGDGHVANLFVMQADGSGVRQLSFNVFNEFNPTLLPDGRLLYGRWEYNERSVTSLHNPFTAHPDGSMVSPYYGNATIRPNVVMFPRPVPGSTKVMALFTAHHGQTHGAVGLLDVRRGIDGDLPLEVLTPKVPVTGEKTEESYYGWFNDPQPLSETAWLCSYTPTAVPWDERSWALYVADRHGNLALVYRDPDISCAEPVPLVRRPRPAVLASAAADTDRLDAEATLLVADVYQGLTGVPRGTAAWLRVLEDIPRHRVTEGGVICTSGTPTYTVKRVFGEVPVEPDGSAHFAVPANRNVYFQVLDADRREIQRMRSVVCLKPGEQRGCIGCHEPRNMAPPPVAAQAFARQPSRPEPPPWGTEVFSFLRDVQPVINARCTDCHRHQRDRHHVILTDDLTDRFTIAYEELLPYLHVADAMRWDHPDDVYPRPPYTYGSKVSPLMEMLAAGHHDVQLSDEDWQRLGTWIDTNAVYYDRYETLHWPGRQIFTGAVRQSVQDVFARRCQTCHGAGDGTRDTWWLSLNCHDVGQSRAVAAPLARTAGGWQQCDQIVFADTTDPDYQKLLGALSGLAEQLAARPRADLLSVQGTAAERPATVAAKLPPPRSPSETETIDSPWVALSDLDWQTARAGWTPNNDGLPRRDREITDNPLRLGRKRYAKGIGTHAPSEIVYDLQGRYARFAATVGAPEAGGTVVFQVYGDGTLLADSGVLRGLGDTADIDIPVAGVQRLRLVVTDAGDHYDNDTANWAAARVLKRVRP
jgi:hypothetical protein